MKRILMLLLCLSLCLSISAYAISCGEDTPPPTPDNEPCDLHSDTNADGKCDSCGEQLTAPEPVKVTVEFTVKDQDGATVSAITAIFTKKDVSDATPISATSGEGGKMSATLETGSYKVSYDYDVDTVGYYISDTSEITVTESTTALDLLLINNNPNGTEERPFSLAMGENSITVPKGSSYYYIVYRAVDLHVSLNAHGVKIIYGEDEYLPDDSDNLTFALLGDSTNSVERFKIENNGDEDITFELQLYSTPGTSGNPFTLDTIGETVTVNAVPDRIVYFTYTAEANATLRLTLTSESSYASMLNTRNSVSVNTRDAVDGSITLEVVAGDEIIIDCSTTASVESEVSFVIESVSE